MFATGSQTGPNTTDMATIDWTSLTERALLDEGTNGSINARLAHLAPDSLSSGLWEVEAPVKSRVQKSPEGDRHD